MTKKIAVEEQKLKALRASVQKLKSELEVVRQRDEERAEKRHLKFYLHTIMEEVAKLFPKGKLEKQRDDSELKLYFKLHAPQMRKEIAESKWQPPLFNKSTE